MHGEGGDDSKLFVDDLFAAYVRYAQSLNLEVDLLNSEFGHKIAKIVGKNAGKAFKYEHGGHVVQRVPPTESKGRRQTSYVNVGILPIRKDVCTALDEKDLETKTQRGHGKGGQHQNKTDSAVRMKHIPTGLTVFINGRDQHANRREALSILTAKVHEDAKLKEQESFNEIKSNQMGSGSRGDKIRTYNFIESRVVDHRLGLKTSNIKAIMKGQFDLIHP